MSYLTLNDQLCIAATVHLPCKGAWTSDVETPHIPSVAVGDPVTLALGSQSFVGTVHRVSTSEGNGFDVRIVGGKNGLSRVLSAAQFVKPTAKNVLDAALTEAAEVLSALSDMTSLATLLDFWERPARTLGQELDALSRLLGLVWRVLPSGDVWLGSDDWTAASVSDYDVLEHVADTGRLIFAADDPTVLPGQTFAGVRASLVIHRITADETRTEILQEDGLDRSLGMLDALTRRAQQTDLHAYYPYQVISQNADGTFELKALDSRMPSLSRVPCSHAIPGTQYTIATGVCLVGFRGGLETMPHVASWTTGTPTTAALPVSSTLHLGSTSAADYVALASLVQSQLSALKAALAGAVIVAGDGGASLKATMLTALSAWPASTAATKVKAT